MFFDFNSPFFWLSFGLVLILLEFVVPGVFLLWVGAAGILVVIPAYLFPDATTYNLILIFIISMGISLWAGVTYQAKRFDASNKLNKGLSAYLGTEAVVAKGSSDDHPFIRIYLGGTTYKARCEDYVSTNDNVKVISVENNNITVEKKHRKQPNPNIVLKS